MGPSFTKHKDNIDAIYDLVRQGKHLENPSKVTEDIVLTYHAVVNDYASNPILRKTMLDMINEKIKSGYKVTLTINLLYQDIVNVVTTPVVINFDSYFYLNNLTKVEGRLQPLNIRPVKEISANSPSDECYALFLKLGIPGVVSMLKLITMVDDALKTINNRY